MRIPFYEPDLSGKERKYINDCITSNWLSWRGPYVSEFEQRFAEFIGVPFASSTCNGTASLHLALKLLGIQPGDEVIIPSLSYVSVANAVLYVGGIPIFADSEVDSWQISPYHVSNLITDKTKAVIAVHLYGGICDVEKLSEICRFKRIHLIEDCSEALGSKHDKAHVGSFGTIGTFSFYANKTITTGEGGMVVTVEEDIWDECNKMKNMYAIYSDDYFHPEIGFNYRMSNITAALGLAQLERVQSIIDRKHKIASLYREFLNNDIVTFQETREKYDPCWWVIAILTDNRSERDLLRIALKKAGVQTKPLFRPLNTLPPFEKYISDCNIAYNLWERGICLPSSPVLTEEEIEDICSIINGVFL